MTVAMPSILRAWRKQGGDQCFLLVRSPGPVAEVADAVQAAMAHANDLEWEETDGGPRVGASAIAGTPKGPVVFIGFCDDQAALVTWVNRFAAALEEQSVVGRLGPARSERTPIDN